MNRLLLTLILALISLPAFAASETIPQLPAAGTILQSTPVPVWSGSTTVQTTAGAIAALGASTSGSGIPGGLSTELQYNNGGNFGGLQDFYVQAYGAKCDGRILTAGVNTTSGSPVISSPDYTFTSADVGAHITLAYPAAANTYFQQNTFDGTIISVSGGNATLSGNVSFNAGPGYPGASARFYHTDDSVAIQNALNAAAQTGTYAYTPNIGGGNIIFPGGVCVGKNLTFYSNENIKGSNVNASVVMLAAGANSDLFIGAEYNALAAVNTNSFANPTCLSDGNCGQYGWSFSDITLDGNRGSNTGSAAASKTGSGDGIRTFGSSWNINRVYITFFATDGLYTLWPQGGGGTPFYTFYSSGAVAGLGYPAGLEAFVDNFESWYNGGWGWVDNGPHDSNASNMWFAANNTGGILNSVANGGGGSPLTVTNYHAYQHPGGKDVDVESPYFSCFKCDLETGFTLNSYGTGWDFSDSRNTGPVFFNSGASGNTFVNFVASATLTATGVPNGGAADTWINSGVSSIAGTYAPNVTTNSSGFGQQKTNVNASAGGPFVLENCDTGGSFTCHGFAQFNTNTSGQFFFGTGTTTSVTTAMAADTSQNVAFGPNANNAGASAGASFDAHFYTGTFVMPTGTLAQRPACVGAIAGGIRYNVTTGNPEFCAGNGIWSTLGTGTVSLATPNQFAAGQSVVPTVVTPSGNNFTPDLALSNNFIITLNHNTSNVLVNPAHFLTGQSGLMYIVQSGSGSDTFGGGYGSQYIVSGGTFPTLSTGAGAIDVFAYSTVTIAATNYVLLNPSLNFHN